METERVRESADRFSESILKNCPALLGFGDESTAREEVELEMFMAVAAELDPARSHVTQVMPTENAAIALSNHIQPFGAPTDIRRRNENSCRHVVVCERRQHVLHETQVSVVERDEDWHLRRARSLEVTQSAHRFGYEPGIRKRREVFGEQLGLDDEISELRIR